MSAGSLRKDAVSVVAAGDNGTSIWKQTQVKDVMETNFCHFAEDMAISAAVGELLRQQLTGAPVIDDRQHLKGFLSLKDCLPFAQILVGSMQAEPVLVGHLMSRETHSLLPHISLEEALKAFVNQWFHVFPVVEGNGQVIGILSRRRLLTFICQ